jgi:hypothetical protein
MVLIKVRELIVEIQRSSKGRADDKSNLDAIVFSKWLLQKLYRNLKWYDQLHCIEALDLNNEFHIAGHFQGRKHISTRKPFGQYLIRMQ